MILQALTKYYEELVEQNESESLPRFGYSCEYISAIVQIDALGNLLSVIPAVDEDIKKKRPEIVPLQMKRSGSKAPPYYLCDNAQYVFGIEKNGVSDKSRRCFTSFRDFHLGMLKGVTGREAEAFSNFLNKWNPEAAFETSAIITAMSYCFNGLLVFRIADTSTYLHQVPALLERWDQYFPSTLSDRIGMCLVTGEESRIARVHNSVKGIQTDVLSPNGWTLVSFDKDSKAFSSYGKIQGYNAPISEYAAFAYTTALNYLLSDRQNVQKIGDTTVVCWAEGAEPQYQAFTFAALFGAESSRFREDDLRDALKKLAVGRPVPEWKLEPDRRFYILGLAPNTPRLSVRFFYRDSFGNLMKNVNAHHERMEITGPSYENRKALHLHTMLLETVNEQVKKKPFQEQMKAISPVLAGAAARAIFTGGLYPAALLEHTMLRIRAERYITCGKAAIIKAYYQRMSETQLVRSVKEGAMEVKLNEDCCYLPYLLGRLFAVMEETQIASAGGKDAIIRTIRDSYFISAAATPSSIFRKLFELNAYHTKKLERDKPGLAYTLVQKRARIMERIQEQIPTRFKADESNAFYIGYYHQMQERFEKKEDK